MLAFSAFVVHDGQQRRADSHFGFGRRMTTSTGNRVSPETTITPDVVAQKNGDYGLAAEVKRSLPKDHDQWDTDVAQLRKYDDDLTGWWTTNNTIERHNAALLVHQSRSRMFTKKLTEIAAQSPDQVGPRSVVIEFNQSQEAQRYIFFRTEFGTVDDEDLQTRLEVGIQIPVDRVLVAFPALQFYDAEPPLPWLIEFLWTDLFGAAAFGKSFDERLGAVPIVVNAATITNELQQAYGSGALEHDSRSVSFPKQTWIANALDALVSINLAIKGDKPGDYTVLYKAFKKDVLERIVDLLLRRGEKKKHKAGSQLALDLPPVSDPESQ